MTDPVVSLEDAGLRYGETHVLHDLTFSMSEGDIVTVIGPNGAGKTSLIKLILGIEKPSSGHVRQRAGTRVGYVPQRMTLQPTLPLTVGRFLGLAGGDASAIEAALARTGVAQLADESVHHLSGGEFQRVLLARAILRRPQLLVLDEPAQGLDVNGQSALYELIRSLRDELNCAVLTVSHDLHVVMASTDTVLCLNGHICCRGQPEQISQDPAFTQLFGENLANTLAVYHHHHNHSHDVHGETVP
ncbi:zinc ABC transporter ATP-binding protein ZnuC [Halovibrio salipaludis]|uniref:Zinc ABC transporter ATP-binding protein ZnuC n=1 Tax=Halovibrio salipaludis TaxID=2032626 RepID=A0A2A2FBT0_9GAMM|nr:zinc ABC transporter ATP-binding protein ZnuC [Halovibrio salipaludis]PAU82079.1 zinc ABC transporter ATP-binding protein ZnuC [Halovibrio salipaludis]